MDKDDDFGAAMHLSDCIRYNFVEFIWWTISKCCVKRKLCVWV